MGELGRWYIFRVVGEEIKEAELAAISASCHSWGLRLYVAKKEAAKKEQAAMRAYLLLQLNDEGEAIAIRKVRAHSVPKAEPAYRKLRQHWRVH